MNKNYVLWAVGAIIVIGIGFMLMQNGSPVTTATASVPDTATTTIVPDTASTGETPNADTGTPSKPIVTTTGFASVSTTTATLVGNVVAQGADTTYWFEYGLTTSFGLSVKNTSAASGYKTVGVATTITDLKPGTQYYFRLGAKNAYGTVYGGPYSFITTTK